MSEETDLKYYKEDKPHILKLTVWSIVNKTIFRLVIGGRYTKKIRNFILRLFGATIAKEACVYSKATIFAPWNLTLGNSCIGPDTNIYSKDKILIGDNVVISQGAYLCTASHNISDPLMALTTSPIVINNRAWIAADAFVGMGVTIGEGAVVGARAAVFKDVEAWTVVGGNPAKFIKKRVFG